MASKLRVIVLACSLGFIIIDLTFRVASVYELLRIIIYGIAINILSEYFVMSKRKRRK